MKSLSDSSQALIAEIKRNALDDGPGIRTLVFFKGCPLRCVWCHNPETKAPFPELLFAAKQCIGCGDCEMACPYQAISLNADNRIDRTKCRDECLRGPCPCAVACPAGALKEIGRYYSVDELYREILRDEPFFRNSGGGVTFSGGEPTLYLAYLSALASQLKGDHIHLTLETNGLFDLEPFLALLAPALDQIYFDLKFMDPLLHERFTGSRNHQIRENFIKLNRLKVVPIVPRIPLIPDITTRPENLFQIASFLREQAVERVELLPYNPLWLEKALGLGHIFDFTAKAFLAEAEKAEIRACFTDFDIGRF